MNGATAIEAKPRRWLAPAVEVIRFARAPRAALQPFESRLAAWRFYAHLMGLVWLCFFAWAFISFGLREASGAGHAGLGAPTLGLLFAIAVVAPVTEELLFRSWLKHCMYLPVIAIYLPIRALVDGLVMAVQVTAVLLTAILMLVKAERVRAMAARGDAGLARVFPVLLHGSTLAFAFAHTVNWDLAPGKVWVLPLLVLPQLLLGYVLAYARMRTGLALAIALHAANNGLMWSLLWLASRLEAA